MTKRWLVLGLVVVLGGLVVTGLAGAARVAVSLEPLLPYVDQEEVRIAETDWALETVRPVVLGVTGGPEQAVLWGWYRDNRGRLRLARLVLGVKETGLAPLTDTTGQVIFPKKTEEYRQWLKPLTQTEATIIAQGAAEPPWQGVLCQQQPRVCRMAAKIGERRILSDWKTTGQLKAETPLYLLGLKVL